LVIPFGQERGRNDILYAIERVEHTGGQTSLVSGAERALKEIASRGRSNHLIIVIISDGNRFGS
jgi:Mg-chelatase subunit ChlD